MIHVPQSKAPSSAKGRSGLTLVEVLATIFILAIGMVSVLVLFPVGALKVRQALINERIALAASSGESAFKILFGTNKDALDWGGSLTPVYTSLADGTSVAVVDPLASGNTFAGSIQTQSFSYQGGIVPKYRRMFTLLDDIEWAANGSPEAAVVARGSGFSFSLFVRKTTLNAKDTFELTTLVYHGRNLNLPNNVSEVDLTLAGAGADFNVVNSSAIEVTVRPTLVAEDSRTLDKGGWIMDTTQVDGNASKQQLEFYQVQNVIDLGAGRIRLELDRPIINRFSSNAVYSIQSAKWVDRLAGVFYKGEINLP